MTQRSDELLEHARELAVTELAVLGREAEATSIVSDDWWQRLSDTGLLRLTLPVRWGGEGLTLTEYFPILEVCAQVHGAVRMIVHGANGTWRALERFGTEEQKQTYMPQLAEGRYNGFCISEPRSGSGQDVGTVAQQTADGWVLNGVKQWATLASKAQLIYIPARSKSLDGEDLGITTFMIEPDRAGVTRKHMAHTMGCKGLDHDVMFFDDCAVPDDHVLGEIGSGLDVALRGFLDPSRLSIALSCVGLAQGALDQALAFTTRRHTFGKPISSRQYVQGRLADMAVDVAATRALVMQTAAAFDRGEPIVAEAAMCKYLGLEMVGRVTDHSMRVHGGVGYTDAYPIEQMYRDARGMWFEEGTAEIQKTVISRELVANWTPALPSGFYGPDPGPDSDELAIQ
ncbi:MAG: acyl-CoA dehydrogenase domain protein [Blastococcus sp.]|jgi:alkylation response protein AidB-like acyl-CoA dehydrogenase|nr:acyl-CoA dehydrogenase domain protein [Blastococcus sp.]